MSWYNEWWVWTVAALVLAIAEILIPAWIFFGFALGALFLEQQSGRELVMACP
jgi:membrane protein implicated in regulation of membrane protease activity